MADATGETTQPLRVAFDRRLKLEFHGAKITSDGGLLAYRELDDVLGLTATAASILAEGRRGKNIRHRLPGLVRQAIYGWLAGYEDVNDAERLACDPAMRAIVGREGLDRPAASTSQMGRFETEWLASDANLGPDGSVRRLDRPGAQPQAAGRQHSRPGQCREPDLRRAGGLGLERACVDGPRFARVLWRSATVGCGHVSGLLMRRVRPLALMHSADRVPITSPRLANAMPVAGCSDPRLDRFAITPSTPSRTPPAGWRRGSRAPGADQAACAVGPAR
jgi:hypothetical protein